MKINAGQLLALFAVIVSAMAVCFEFQPTDQRFDASRIRALVHENPAAAKAELRNLPARLDRPELLIPLLTSQEALQPTILASIHHALDRRAANPTANDGAMLERIAFEAERVSTTGAVSAATMDEIVSRVVNWPSADLSPEAATRCATAMQNCSAR